MLEAPQDAYESGDTVGTLNELVEAIDQKPKGFSVMINVQFGKQNKLWGDAEQLSGQKLTMSIKKLDKQNGKPACLVELMVI